MLSHDALGGSEVQVEPEPGATRFLSSTARLQPQLSKSSVSSRADAGSLGFIVFQPASAGALGSGLTPLGSDQLTHSGRHLTRVAAELARIIGAENEDTHPER
jgi:hypothetical protein